MVDVYTERSDRAGSDSGDVLRAYRIDAHWIGEEKMRLVLRSEFRVVVEDGVVGAFYEPFFSLFARKT